MSAPSPNSVFYLHQNAAAQAAAVARGLQITPVTWEDTSRSKNSIWGRNISDMTLRTTGGGRDVVWDNMNRNAQDDVDRNEGDEPKPLDGTLCPVVRKPNFFDLTCDLSIGNFKVKVGNEEGKDTLELKSLKDYLSAIPSKDGPVNLIVERDTSILVSSQACILPLKDGSVQFCPCLYNYQTRHSSPALLVVLSTSQGTSAQIVYDKPQSLSYNLNGKVCQFLATRLRDDRAARGVPLDGAMDREEIERNLLAIYCIPLEQTQEERHTYGAKPTLAASAVPSFGFVNESAVMMSGGLFGVGGGPVMGFGGFGGDYLSAPSNSSVQAYGTLSAYPVPPMSMGMPLRVPEQAVDRYGRDRDGAAAPPPPRGIDHAMLGITKPKGEFLYSPKKFSFKRDPRFPIRLTLQRYQVTDTGDVPVDVFTAIAKDINKLYSKADSVGSLVVDPPSGRVTESSPPKSLPGSFLSDVFSN